MQIVKTMWANADIRDLIPIGMIFATAVIDSLWNLHAGIIWRAPLIEALATPMLPLAIAMFYTAVRPDRQIAEAALFIALWWIYGIFGGQLSYLGIALGYPLRDADLARFDAVLGFDWRLWSDFANSQQWVRYAQQLAYDSFYWQPLISAAIFAKCCAGRNRELLTAIIIATTLTITVGTLFPAFGPGRAYGIPAPWYDVIAALRSGAHEPLPYVGVITFPSLHAVAAVLLSIAHRGIKWTFAPVLLLNTVMLLSLPLYGNHYLVDVLSGVLVAGISFLLARALISGAESFFSASPQHPAPQPAC